MFFQLRVQSVLLWILLADDVYMVHFDLGDIVKVSGLSCLSPWAIVHVFAASKE